ncbi:type IV secretory system conjugative DNA transfer family protein [Escherichia coli]|uniref:type IV secretory system conjugative DNA transfer family protein n=1 Tax=Escherichia coli TaxID=562 RepID=UPI00388E7933
MNIFMVLQDGLTSRIIKAAGLLNDEGFTLAHGKTKTASCSICVTTAARLTTYAPTRSGKVSALVVPTLLSRKHSTVVADLKKVNCRR